jgi:lipopolysaccharide transport system ATP-binding protein
MVQMEFENKLPSSKPGHSATPANDSAITVANLGKAYKQYSTRWSRLAEWVLPGGKPRHTLKWVLRNIDFTVRPGEAVGIVGINGAGKSTLLKMITGTTKPTTGEVAVNGRVAALLELGMGFHPDFTGRQNAFMAAQLLGCGTNEIPGLLPHIESFAEIGDYIDQPVRVYSSGMQVRLAFSVATAARPDVLIVDEALSVGDTYFQHKSFERIRQFRQQGTTLMIVSHDKSAIQSICDRAILLREGTIAMQGAPEAVMDYYNATLADHQNQTIRREPRGDGKVRTISGTGEAVIVGVALFDDTGSPVEVIDVGACVTLQIKARARKKIPKLIVGYTIKNRLGEPMYGTNTELKECPEFDFIPEEELTVDFRFKANLGPGTYSVTAALSSSETHLENSFQWRDLALIFTVMNFSKPHFVGCAWLDPSVVSKRTSR